MDRLHVPGSKAPSDQVAEARIEAQNATQWLARMARSYGTSAPQGDPRLHWDRSAQKIVTPEVAPGLVLELFLPTLTLQFAEDGKPSPHAIDVDGKSSTEVEAWLLVELLHRGFDRDNFSKQLPYRWSHLMTGDEAKYSPQSLVDELKQLTQWFDDAAVVLVDVQSALKAEGFKSEDDAPPTELLCWPDHFEVGFSVPIFPGSEAEGSVKIGFTAGDDADNRPGFFVRRETGTSIEANRSMLPLSQIKQGGLSNARIAEDLVAKVKEVRLASSN